MIFEHEVRFMLNHSNDEGIYIPVQLENIVHKVIFSPYNPAWVNNSIKKLFSTFMNNAVKFEKSKIIINP